MKYIIVIGDGMADEPLHKLGNKTPLEVANVPTVDALALHSTIGIVTTVPDGYKPGSDVANLSIFGYDPKEVYTGRSPLEAINLGVKLNDNDIAIRCNLVSLSDAEKYEDKNMISYSAGEISTEEASELIDIINKNFQNDKISFYLGTSYRHCTILSDTQLGTNLTPPHDITNKKITNSLPSGINGDVLKNIMIKSFSLLENHKVNKKREENGLLKANSVWFWGEGSKPILKNFYDIYGKKAGVISAVDLIKGIGKASGMTVLNVKGATGNLHTNYQAKVDAAIELLKSNDCVFIHVEAPDECGHQGDIEGKIKAIEDLDEKIINPIKTYFEKNNNDFKLLFLPDHPTPLNIMTHSSDPVPFLCYDSRDRIGNNANKYTEEIAKKTNLTFHNGPSLLKWFLGEKNGKK